MLRPPSSIPLTVLAVVIMVIFVRRVGDLYMAMSCYSRWATGLGVVFDYRAGQAVSSERLVDHRFGRGTAMIPSENCELTE